MTEKPSTGRASILTTGNSLEIKIPTKKRWAIVAFTILWIIGFTLAGQWMMNDMQSPDKPDILQKFLVFGVAGWTFALICAVAIILWLTGGLEIVKIDNGILTVKKKIYFVGLTNRYQIDLIRNLTLNPNTDNNQLGFGTPNNFLNLKGGVIKFDYGMRTIKFGGGIDEAEGRQLLTTFRQNSNFKETNFE